MPTTAERLAAYVAAEKQKKRDVEEAAERVKEVRRAKEAALLAEREEQAAAAADERLRLATYKMPPDEPQQQPNSPSSQQHPQQQHPQQQHPQQQQQQHEQHHRPTTAKRSQKAAAERHVARRKPAGKDAPSLPPTSRTGGGPASAATAADLLYGPTSEASRAPLDDEAAGPPIQADLALFVHFLPPPLRDPAKPHLSWIVHTCDGSGCHAAKHVSFFGDLYHGTPEEMAREHMVSGQASNSEPGVVLLVNIQTAASVCTTERLSEEFAKKMSNHSGLFALDSNDRDKLQQPSWVDKRSGRGERTRLAEQNTSLTAALPFGVMRQAMKTGPAHEFRVKHR